MKRRTNDFVFKTYRTITGDAQEIQSVRDNLRITPGLTANKLMKKCALGRPKLEAILTQLIQDSEVYRVGNKYYLE